VRTFQGKHEIIEGILVLFISLFIVLFQIFVDGALDDVDGSLNTNVKMLSLSSAAGLLTSKLVAIFYDEVSPGEQ
jgi:hypothetical protein